MAFKISEASRYRMLDLLQHFLKTGLIVTPCWNRYYGDPDHLNPAEQMRIKSVIEGTAPPYMTWLSDIKIPLKKTALSKAFYTSGTYEPYNMLTLSRLIDKGNIVVDIGANNGVFSLFSALLTGPSGQIHAFEPSPREYRDFCHSLHFNPPLAPRIHLYKTALSDQKALAYLKISDDINSGLNTLSDVFCYDVQAVQTLEVQTETLDGFVQKNSLAALDFVKIDVEGFEAHILRGGRKSITRFKPYILMEYNQQALTSAGTKTKTLEKIIKDIGYHSHAIDNQTGDLIPVHHIGDHPALDIVLAPERITRYDFDHQSG